MQDLESMFDGWTEDLAHLTVLRESLSSYISSEDLCVLQERIELLQRQWEEICHQVLFLCFYYPTGYMTNKMLSEIYFIYIQNVYYFTFKSCVNI